MTKKQTPGLSRRNALSLAAAGTASLGIGGLAHAPAHAASSTLWDFDTAKPEDAVKLYAKMAGSLAAQDVYMQYYGEIHSMQGNAVPLPILKLKGLIRLRWTPNDDGTYTYSNYDHGLFCDVETGKAIDRFENPLTGEINEPLHYKSGPLSSTIGLGEGQEDPTKKEWRVSGNQIIVRNSRTSSFPNPLQPDKWGRASTGERVPVLSSSSYIGDVREVADPKLSTVDTDHVWNFATGYPAWMLMGQTDGIVLWHWTARKFANAAEIDPYILGEINDRVPNFLELDEPWPERSDGWTQYTRERQPEE